MCAFVSIEILCTVSRTLRREEFIFRVFSQFGGQHQKLLCNTQYSSLLGHVIWFCLCLQVVPPSTPCATASTMESSSGSGGVASDATPTLTIPGAEVLEEEPLYVNAKQYHRILKRRQARAKLEARGKISKERKVSGIVSICQLVCDLKCRI